MLGRRKAHIGGLSFFETLPDRVGDWLIFDEDGIKNVWGGVDVRREEIARPSAHGSFGMPGFLGSRVIPLSGHILAHSRESMEKLQSRLSGLLADGSYGRLTIDGPVRGRWCDVQLGSTQITELDATTARFLLTLWAADPRTYGKLRTFTDEPASHEGNFPATPRLMIGAGTGGYWVYGPGDRTVGVSTPPAEAHYIDFSNGGLFTMAGVRVPGAITTYRPWTIPPGQQVAASISGSRSLGQRLTDTFV